MHARGVDLWPAALTQDLVEETHLGWRMRCYPSARPRTVGGLLDRAAERFPDRDAVVDAAERLTWRELAERARRLATALHRRHGIKPGDRVALLLRNGSPFCVAVFACAQLGAITVTLNTKLKARELEFMLQNAGARVLLTNPEEWPQIDAIRERLPCEAYYRTPYPELFAERPSPPPVLVHEEDAAFIMYTSGTTGRPKGAMGTHLGIINSAITYERCYGLGDGERTLVAVPLFHVTGLIAQFLTLAHLGGTVVVMPTFDAAEALRLIDAERITHMIAAPTVFVPTARLYHKWGASTDEHLHAAKDESVRARLPSINFSRLVNQQRNHLRFALKCLDARSFVVLLALKTAVLPIVAIRHPIVARAFVAAVGRLMRELPGILRLRRAIHASAVRTSAELIAEFIADGGEARRRLR